MKSIVSKNEFANRQSVGSRVLNSGEISSSREVTAPNLLSRLGSVFRFGKLSILSFALNLGLTVGLHEWLQFTTTIAFAISIVIVYLFNFVGMRLYVFPQRAESGPSVVKQATAFLITSAAFRVLDYGAFLLFNVVFGLYYVVAIVIVSGISFVLKFFFYRRWVFAGKKN
ncbi:MAG: GtrA family protein [Mariniblastus sp.]